MIRRSKMSRFRKAYQVVAILFLNTVLIAIALNLLAAGGMSVQQSWRQRDRRGGPALDRALQAHPGWNPDDVAELHAELERLDHFEYAPFTEVRVHPQADKFINVSPNGYRYGRDRAPWPPDPAALNVFVFGGSTAFGDGVADAETLPWYLQERLSQQNSSRRVAVYNFACPGYMSTQERILFEQLLLIGAVPDVAIFVDGLNDAFEGDRSVPPYPWGTRMSTILRALVERYHDNLWGQVAAAARDLPAVRLLSGAVRHDPPETHGREENVAARIVEQWHANRRMIEAVARVAGVRTLFVWQPVPFFHYDLGQDLFADEVEPSEGSMQVYELMQREAQAGNAGEGFLWLGDMQTDRRENLYVDSCHYTASFNDEIAAEIAKGLQEKNLLTKRAVN